MRYQRIEVNTWWDEKFTKLSDDGKFMFLYVLTSPHSNSIGAYVLKKGYIAEDLNPKKWPIKRIDAALAELLKAELIKYDEVVFLIVIIHYMDHNPIENPNQCKSAIKNYYALPKSFILEDVSNRLETVAKRFKNRFERVAIYDSVYDSVSVKKEEGDPKGEEKGKAGDHPDPEKGEPANSDVKIFVDYAFQTFQKQFSDKLLIDGKKDGAIVKKLLGTYSLERLKGLWDVFMLSTDPFICQAGRSIGVFKTQINKLISGNGSGPAPAAPTVPNTSGTEQVDVWEETDKQYRSGGEKA
jgi:hypothetical protein